MTLCIPTPKKYVLLALPAEPSGLLKTALCTRNTQTQKTPEIKTCCKAPWECLPKKIPSSLVYFGQSVILDQLNSFHNTIGINKVQEKRNSTMSDTAETEPVSPASTMAETKPSSPASTTAGKKPISPPSTTAETKPISPPSTVVVDPDTRTNDTDSEQKNLATAQANRLKITQEFTKELNDIQTKSSLKGKTKLRKKLVKTIFRVAMTIYTTEDDEYAAIGKFYRGMFRHVCNEKLFDKAEKELLTNIARVFGAFDY